MKTEQISVKLLADIVVALDVASDALVNAPGVEAWEAYKRVVKTRERFQREVLTAETKTANPEESAA